MVKSVKKYTVITGASSGIGRDSARVFASKGKNLVLVARRKENLETLKKELIQSNEEIDVVITVCDLSDIKQVYSLYDDLKNLNIETWINNAGLGHGKIITDQDLGKVSSMIHLNIEAVTILSTLYAKEYKDVEGTTLINVASTVGYGVSSRCPAYSSTKFFVSSFTEALYFELREINAKMRAKVLAPAATSTEFMAVSTGKEIDMSHFEGNTSKEMAEFLYKLYESDKALGYAETDDYSLHLCDPKISHTFTKKTNPNLLK